MNSARSFQTHFWTRFIIVNSLCFNLQSVFKFENLKKLLNKPSSYQFFTGKLIMAQGDNIYSRGNTLLYYPVSYMLIPVLYWVCHFHERVKDIMTECL